MDKLLSLVRGFELVGSFVPGTLLVCFVYFAFVYGSTLGVIVDSSGFVGFVALAAVIISVGHGLSFFASLLFWACCDLGPTKLKADPTTNPTPTPSDLWNTSRTFRLMIALRTVYRTRLYGMATVARLFGGTAFVMLIATLTSFAGLSSGKGKVWQSDDILGIYTWGFVAVSALLMGLFFFLAAVTWTYFKNWVDGVALMVKHYGFDLAAFKPNGNC